jgi:quercetin dioxygenase-like cupin family protein
MRIQTRGEFQQAGRPPRSDQETRLYTLEDASPLNALRLTEVTSVIISLPPGSEAKCLTHPISGHVFVLRGSLMVEFENGLRSKFKSGQCFFHPRMEWHRCINEGKKPMRFLLVLPRRKDPEAPRTIN